MPTAGEERARLGLIGAPWVCAIVFGGALLIGSRSAFPQAPQGPPKTPGKVGRSASCATNECHNEAREYRYVHWTDFVKECRKCHVQKQDMHDFEMAEGSALCFECHEELAEAMAEAKIIHDPAEEDCIDCHGPHGSEAKGLLEEENLKGLCFECHDEDEILTDEYEHGPVQKGACSKCHNPHASSRAKLLVAVGNDLCFGCHEELAELMEESEYVHDPAEDDCMECHAPHTGPYPGMLPAAKRRLCEECHDDIVAIVDGAKVDHDPARTGDECLNCHSPHAANSEPNLKQPQLDLCLGCHDDPVESGGSKLLDMKGWLDENREWHKPIRENNCSGCHEPHGGANFRLLTEPFPSRFYAGFSLDTYKLCFSCHEDTLVTVERTEDATGFRDGDRNLHFLHVNKEKRGRTCRACHEMHASPYPLLIRKRVPYGKWMMPINFRKGETGGSCHPGCHEAETYDRGK